MSNNQHDTRRDYAAGELRRADLADDPLDQFKKWFNHALDAEVLDATAMTLATAGADGQPSARIVLLKQYDADGFVWYTDYASRKGLDLAENPQAALLFYWREFERQVRISGPVELLTKEKSSAYFLSRPLESRLSAAASQQSRPVSSRAALEAQVAALARRYPDNEVPAPQQWGGYVLKAREYEFWQGRVGRLHDRFSYRLDGSRWVIERLQP